MKAPSYDLRPCPIGVVEDLCSRYHAYGGAGGQATYAFAVYEEGEAVAAYAWQPPPPGSARKVCPEAPWAVLSLSRMAAVPRADRTLNHVSKPLRRQMRTLIDRGRWPALVTYHDIGQGHTGHVYRCSGWRMCGKPTRRPTYADESGRRVSNYGDGRMRGRKRTGWTHVQRWEHWACEPAAVLGHVASAGWVHRPIPGKVWRSGRQAYKIVKVDPGPLGVEP